MGVCGNGVCLCVCWYKALRFSEYVSEERTHQFQLDFGVFTLVFDQPTRTFYEIMFGHSFQPHIAVAFPSLN